MKKFFVSFLLLCALSGCHPAPVPSTCLILPKVVLSLNGGKIYEKSKPFCLVVEYYNEELKSWDLVGSAFVIEYKGKQFVVTAKHVWMPDEKERIKDSKGNIIPIKSAKLALSDDIAILEVDSLPFRGGLKLADKNPRIGIDVYHIGNPLGIEFVFTNGIVSQYEDSDLISSTPLAPGSSGGVLLDFNGQVVGLAVSIDSLWKHLNYYEPVESLKALIG